MIHKASPRYHIGTPDLSACPIWYNKSHFLLYIIPHGKVRISLVHKLFTKGTIKMRTAEEIINYLETELAEQYRLHNETKRNKDKGDAYASLVRIVMLEEILEKIKK